MTPMSTARAYYNEFDPKAAAWLRELIKEGHIAPGDVDERSILDILPRDLDGYTQCHFFAGIGGWSYALRLAGWPDDKPVWTGSCPCQPFSSAGKGGGFADERHLWPAFHYLIEQRRPAVVFGEQVASKDGLAWLDLVQTDLEGAGYTSGAVDLCAAGVGAPHIRQRLYWVGDARSAGTGRDAGTVSSAQTQRDSERQFDGCGSDGVEYASAVGGTHGQRANGIAAPIARSDASDVDDVGDADDSGSQGRHERRNVACQRGTWPAGVAIDWVACRDQKFRPIESVAQRMAYGLSLALEFVRNFSRAEKETLINAANRTGVGAEMLCALWEANGAPEIWPAFGIRIGFQEAFILLALLREHARFLGVIFDGVPSGSAENSENTMSALWQIREAARTPHRPQLSEQQIGEFRNAMPKLPQEASLFCAFTGFPLASKVPGRVGLLRGYGNAIVPQVAAAFIEAYLDTLG